MEQSKRPRKVSDESEIAHAETTITVPRFLWLVLGLHMATAFTYSWLIPPDRGPDEPHHLAYIEHLHNYHELPHLTSSTATRDERDNAIAIHPPVYYVSGWPVYELIKGLPRASVERVYRWFAIIMGAATVFLTWRIGMTLFPDNPSLALTAATFVAFLPEFQLLSSVMNNDGPMMLLSTTFLLILVRNLNRSVSQKQWALLGMFYGVIVMTKASGAAIFPVALVALLYHWRTQSLNWRQAITRIVSFYIPALAVAAWWFADLYHRWGRLQPIPRSDLAPLLLHNSVEDLLTSGRGWMCVQRFLIGAQQSIWGQVDWFLPMNGQSGAAFYEASVRMYDVFSLIAFVSLAGLLWIGVKAILKKASYSPQQITSLILLAADFLLAYAALAQYTLFVHPGGFQGGRYLYPSVAAFSTLFAVGLCQILPHRLHRWIAPTLLAGLLLWNVFCALNLIGYLNPTYAPGEGIQIQLW